MCGIFAILGSNSDDGETRMRVARATSKLRHRGPDWSGIKSFETSEVLSCALAHERLQIIDPNGGEQPIVDREGDTILSINGEIYNYKQLLEDPDVAQFLPSVMSKSDCEAIIPTWKALLKQYEDDANCDFSRLTIASLVATTLNQKLDGDFAYVMYDLVYDVYVVARDPIGVNPLYIGYSDLDGSIIISSEIKAFDPTYVTDFREFPPGHVLVANSFMDGSQTFDEWLATNTNLYWWSRPSTNFPSYPSTTFDISMELGGKLRSLLTEAVKKRLMSDVPIGFLLSGGLDSSLICSIATKLMPAKDINTFSIGLKGSPDLAAARKVAEYLGTKHHEFEFTAEQGISSLSDVIYSLETFDVTTIRAGTPMYLLTRRVKALGIKVLLSGEGSDEIFGGYLYFHKAPNSYEFYEETVDKLLALSKYDCLRANKSVAAFGCEIRVPFLDLDFVQYVMNINPHYKMISDQRPIEKWILRQAFEGYLPHDILYRQKEQFSDGVGYNWIDSLKLHVAKQVSNLKLMGAESRFPQKTPKGHEAYYYRMLFEEVLKHPRAYVIVPWSKSVACSTERALKWQKEWETADEPSGRSVDVHASKK